MRADRQTGTRTDVTKLTVNSAIATKPNNKTNRMKTRKMIGAETFVKFIIFFISMWVYTDVKKKVVSISSG